MGWESARAEGEGLDGSTFRSRGLVSECSCLGGLGGFWSFGLLVFGFCCLASAVWLLPSVFYPLASTLSLLLSGFCSLTSVLRLLLSAFAP